MNSEKTYQYIKYSGPKDGVCTLSLNRPEKRNALNNQMTLEIKTVLESLVGNPEARVVILRGEGPSFCSGFDLDVQKEEAQATQTDASKLLFQELDNQFFSSLANIQQLLWESPVVSIARLQGYAIESGLALALRCDMVIAADDARLLWRPVGGAGMLWHLWPWTVGLRKTKELLFEGDYVTGTEAEKLGMINKSVPLESLDEEVERRARKIAQRPKEHLYLDKISANSAFEAMGLQLSCKSSAVAHILSHLTGPSLDLREKLEKGTKKEVRDILDRRSSPRKRSEE